MLTTLLASIALAAGADWTATFGPAETGSYLDNDHSKVLVVAAGDPASQAKEAAAAFVSALRQSGRADLVMTSESLGDVAALDDPSIVKRASALPVTRIAVVRVFPGAADQPLTAVISFYDKAGATTGALSAMAGQPLAARTGAGQNEGVSNQAVSAVTGIQKQAVETSKKATEEYDLNYIDFTAFGFPYQGKYRKPLEGADFYKALGRFDLSKKYEASEATRWTLMISGIALAVVGPLLPILARSADPLNGEDTYRQLLIPGLLIGGVGLGVWLYAYSYWSSNPIPPAEARHLADEHNVQLRKKLGLPPPTSGGVSMQVGVSPTGLQFSGTF